MPKNKFGFNIKHLKINDVIHIQRDIFNDGFYIKKGNNCYIGFRDYSCTQNIAKKGYKGCTYLVHNTQKEMDTLISAIASMGYTSKVIYA